jgi:hypothetical protein
VVSSGGAVAIVVDAETTSFLMMGALSSGEPQTQNVYYSTCFRGHSQDINDTLQLASLCVGCVVFGMPDFVSAICITSPTKSDSMVRSRTHNQACT